MNPKRAIGIYLSAFPFLLIALLGLSLLRNSQSGAAARDHLLSAGEMTATFGDGTCPCKKEYQCKAGFTASAKTCGYCTKDNTPYERCCNLGDKTRCEYSTTEPCSGSDYMIGPTSGSVGTCNSCTPGTVAKQGTCALRTATTDSNSCP